MRLPKAFRNLEEISGSSWLCGLLTGTRPAQGDEAIALVGDLEVDVCKPCVAPRFSRDDGRLDDMWLADQIAGVVLLLWLKVGASASLCTQELIQRFGKEDSLGDVGLVARPSEDGVGARSER